MILCIVYPLAQKQSTLCLKAVAAPCAGDAQLAFAARYAQALGALGADQIFIVFDLAPGGVLLRLFCAVGPLLAAALAAEEAADGGHQGQILHVLLIDPRSVGGKQPDGRKEQRGYGNQRQKNLRPGAVLEKQAGKQGGDAGNQQRAVQLVEAPLPLELKHQSSPRIRSVAQSGGSVSETLPSA